MAQRRRRKNRPQFRHKSSRGSRHDRRSRLARLNPRRRRTTTALVPLVGWLATAVSVLRTALDARVAFRMSIVVAGILLAEGRRTASAWFVAAGVMDDWDRFYDVLIHIGRRSQRVSALVVGRIVDTLRPAEQAGGHGPAIAGRRVVLGIDDTPEKRHGRHVEGAGVHHDPTSGPAGGEFCYGHNWVTLAWLARREGWGTLALAVRSLLYVREKDVPKLDARHGWTFRTKHQLAAELVEWFVATLARYGTGLAVWVVADGAYAAKPFLDAMRRSGVTVVSRLRKDAALFDQPAARQPGRRGRPRKYGDKLSLAKRAGHRRGWRTITHLCRGEEVTRAYKRFVAISKFTGEPIRVVLVRFDRDTWIPCFCTDVNAEIRDILEIAGDRWSLEEMFHDTKEVWGAGEQQVRNVWSNIGCWHLNQRLYTLVELESWKAGASELADRADRPWDNPSRRPSHADRRRKIAREMPRNQFPATPASTPESRKTRDLLETLIKLCT